MVLAGVQGAAAALPFGSGQLLQPRKGLTCGSRFRAVGSWRVIHSVRGHGADRQISRLPRRSQYLFTLIKTTPGIRAPYGILAIRYVCFTKWVWRAPAHAATSGW